ELLGEQGWRPRDLDAVIVSRGPGSYTGLRVGIMAAKTLAYATGCAVLAIDTFAVIAHQGPAAVAGLDVLADAQQGKVYVQGFARPTAGGPMTAQSPLRIERFEDWAARREPQGWASGPGVRVHQDNWPSGILQVEPGRWDPRPESLLDLGLA